MPSPACASDPAPSSGEAGSCSTGTSKGSAAALAPAAPGSPAAATRLKAAAGAPRPARREGEAAGDECWLWECAKRDAVEGEVFLR